MGLQRTPEALLEVGKLRQFLDKTKDRDNAATSSIKSEFDAYASRRGPQHWSHRGHVWAPRPNAKITDMAAAWVRALYFSGNSTVASISQTLQVSGAAIYSILQGRTHRRVSAGYGLPLHTLLAMVQAADRLQGEREEAPAATTAATTILLPPPPDRVLVGRRTLIARMRRALKRIQCSLYWDHVQQLWGIVSREDGGKLIKTFSDLEGEARALGLLKEWESVMPEENPQPRVIVIDANIDPPDPPDPPDGGEGEGGTGQTHITVPIAVDLDVLVPSGMSATVTGPHQVSVQATDTGLEHSTIVAEADTGPVDSEDDIEDLSDDADLEDEPEPEA
jgi:hypothetical protein